MSRCSRGVCSWVAAAPGGCLLQSCYKELRVVPLYLLNFTLPAEKKC